MFIFGVLYIYIIVGTSLSSFIRQTRILAKFCGVLVFWPYTAVRLLECLVSDFPHTSTSGMQSNIQLIKETKLLSIPVIDLVRFLREGTRDGSIAINLPWIVEFLAMIKYIFT